MNRELTRQIASQLAIRYWQTRIQPPSSNLIARGLVPNVDEFIGMVEAVEHLLGTHGFVIVPKVNSVDEDGVGG